MSEWIDLPSVAVPHDLTEAIGGHPLVAMTLARRGMTDVGAARAFLDADHYAPAAASDLPNLDRAVKRLERAVAGGEEILVWGDFDVDGQTATTVLVSALQSLGGSVRYHIPHRERESHGLHRRILEGMGDDGVQVVVTCDTGVDGHEAVDYAEGRGVDVVVTDHHDLPEELPRAHAVVNPKMLGADHPLRDLPGVGCAWQVARALCERAGRANEAEALLDLVALGIVADVAAVRGDTRYLLQRGLEVLRDTRRLGLRVMMEMADVNITRVSEEQIGFALAPRLNSLGRLADATVAVEFLRTDDLARARVLATEMEGLNAQRRLLGDQIMQAAESWIEREPELLSYGAIVLGGEAWPGGVIGVVAGRLARRYSRPVVLFSIGADGLARGSARSVDGVDISAAIRAHGDMLESFVGHPMAAGMSIRSERIAEFRTALSEAVREVMPEVGKKPALRIDGYVSVGEISLEVVDDLERLAPFGAGNPALTLVSRDMAVAGRRTVGRNGEHVVISAEDRSGTRVELIWWQGAGQPVPEGRFDLAYLARSSDFRGKRRVQLEWIDARSAEAKAVSLSRDVPAVVVIDHRKEARPGEVLAALRAEGDVSVWSEAGHRSDVDGHDRRALPPGWALAIWTTPPSPAVLNTVIEQVSPGVIYLFARDPGLDDPEQFLKRLAGLAKRALREADGVVSVAALEAATATTGTTVRAGISWLAARGDVRIAAEDGDEVRLTEGGESSAAEARECARLLRDLLRETAAYRAHFARADKDALLRLEGGTLDAV